MSLPGESGPGAGRLTALNGLPIVAWVFLGTARGTAAPPVTGSPPDAEGPVLEAGTLQRPGPWLELGNPFQGQGALSPGFEVPGGAVWQPSVTVFGTCRTAVQAFNDGRDTFSELAARLDLFANLQLTGTERVLAGIRPLDRNGRFTEYSFSTPTGFQNELNADLTTLFFEGDFGEILPGLDPMESRSLDWGVAVGRQPLVIQDGMLINDILDGVGLSRNTLFLPGASNLRITSFYAWNNIHRNDNREDESAHLIGVFTESDWPATTVSADVVYVLDEDGATDGLYWGVGAVQRIGRLNTSFRLLGSHALQGESGAVSDGYLLFSEISWTPPRTDDNGYVNAFWGIDEFSSAARAPDAGGPLGRTGILFASLGLGRYGAPLGSRAHDSVGAAVGYQKFFDETRKQLVVELGARGSTRGREEAAMALGARYQQAIGQHLVLQLDAFGSIGESRDPGFGGRVELRYEF